MGASGPCRLQAVADLPVTLVHYNIEVKGSVNRSDAWLTIDTGAERTVLTTAAVKTFLLAHSPTASLILLDRPLTHLSATRTSRQSVRQSPREADTQCCD